MSGRTSQLAAVCLGLAMTTAACAADGDAAPAAKRSSASLFEVPSAQRAHLQVVAVHEKPVTFPVLVPAMVAFDELKTSRVVPLVSGKVTKVMVQEGDRVKSGQTLLSIASPDSSDLSANLARDRSALRIKQVILSRDQDLYAHKAISLEELQQAELDVAAAKATLRDDEAHLSITGGVNSEALVRSPIAGLVVSRTIAVGETVQAGSTQCFTITDPAAVWIIAQLYQQDLRVVALGDTALIRSPVLSTPLEGKVSYIGASIDADTLTIPVRIEAQNPDGVLKRGMYVNAEVIPQKIANAKLVPVAAVLRDEDNLPFTYLEVSPGKFARRHVELGPQVGDDYAIEGGLKDGEKVLADGALFVQFADSLDR